MGCSQLMLAAVENGHCRGLLRRLSSETHNDFSPGANWSEMLLTWHSARTPCGRVVAWRIGIPAEEIRVFPSLHNTRYRQWGQVDRNSGRLQVGRFRRIGAVLCTVGTIARQISLCVLANDTDRENIKRKFAVCTAARLPRPAFRWQLGCD